MCVPLSPHLSSYPSRTPNLYARLYRRPRRAVTTPRAFGYVLDAHERVMLLRVDRMGALSGPCFVPRHAHGTLSLDLESMDVSLCAPRSSCCFRHVSISQGACLKEAVSFGVPPPPLFEREREREFSREDC